MNQQVNEITDVKQTSLKTGKTRKCNIIYEVDKILYIKS